MFAFKKKTEEVENKPTATRRKGTVIIRVEIDEIKNRKIEKSMETKVGSLEISIKLTNL